MPRAIYCESLPCAIDSISIHHGKNGSLTIDDFYVVLNNDTIRIDEDNLAALQKDSAIINLKFTSKNSVPVKFVYTITKNQQLQQHNILNSFRQIFIIQHLMTFRRICLI